jgi:hypothetical protein
MSGRRSWQHYDVEMNIWPTRRDGRWLAGVWGEPRVADYWSKALESMYHSPANTWNTQWFLACWIQNGLLITPNVNLVSNIGFGTGAVRTTNSNSPLANLPVEAVDFPLRHLPLALCDSQADEFTAENIVKPNLNGLLWRAVAKLKKRFRR